MDWPAAIDALRDALALGADVYGIEATLADALHAAGDHNGAIRVWTDLSGRYPDHAQVWVSLGQALLRVSRFDEAMAAIRKAKELSPTEPAIDFLLATGLALSGSIPEAQAAYADLVLRRPADVRAWLETDAVFEAALDRLPNRTAILRRLDIPPEIE
jgi:Flp pilus assembly protein TadD